MHAGPSSWAALQLRVATASCLLAAPVLPLAHLQPLQRPVLLRRHASQCKWQLHSGRPVPLGCCLL